MRVAIFGGTFDPIHTAHLCAAREAVNQCGVDRVLFVPASQPPHKGGATRAAYEDRYRMVQLACQGQPDFEASRLEQGDGPNYSIDTIARVKAELQSGDELFFLIGADAFAEIQTWRRWEEVVREVAFIVVTRPGHRYSVPAGARVHRLETVALPVSSSEMRAKLSAGETPAEIPPEVMRYIRERRLYQPGHDAAER